MPSVQMRVSLIEIDTYPIIIPGMMLYDQRSETLVNKDEFVPEHDLFHDTVIIIIDKILNRLT